MNRSDTGPHGADERAWIPPHVYITQTSTGNRPPLLWPSLMARQIISPGEGQKSYLWPTMARQLPHPQWPFPSLLVSPACPPACRPRMCCACVHVLLAPALGRSKRNVGYGRAPLGRLISNTTHRPKCNCLCWTAGLSGWSLTPAGLGGLASVGGALWLFGVLC